MVPRLREYCRQAQAEVVSKSRNKVHQTWGPPFRGALFWGLGYNDAWNLAKLPKPRRAATYNLLTTEIWIHTAFFLQCPAVRWISSDSFFSAIRGQIVKPFELQVRAARAELRLWSPMIRAKRAQDFTLFPLLKLCYLDTSLEEGCHMDLSLETNRCIKEILLPNL